MDTKTKQKLLDLIGKSRDAIVGSIDDDGFPNAKAMFRIKNDGLSTFWFSTNVSAIRTAQFMQRPKACIYFTKRFHGLMLTGTMQVHMDDETKKAFWRTGDEMYYKLGPTDPDYCVLKFTASMGRYYANYKSESFIIE